MKKVVGYVVSVVGIGVMVLGFGLVDLELKFLSGVAGNYIAGAGIVAVIVGVVIALMSDKGKSKKKVKGGEEEIPIYEGVGKKRKVVGYRKD